MAGSHGYRFEEGALLDIHDYAVPVFPIADYPLLPESLVTSIVALARIQAAIQRGGNEAAEQILPLLRDWIIPRVLRLPESLREAYGAWFKAAFDDLLRDQPELRRELRRIIYIEEAEVVMNTFGNIIAAKEKEGEARGEKRVLVQFVAEFWNDDEAARFARQLDNADRNQFPTITDLMRDQAAGRLPRLRQNGRTGPGQ
ncbi:MAG: hypothetical protein F4X16_00765 [Caldilineaceae bacterium SB0661_bin_34]|nr:hypothetical protein [Caldilineaceae bacterium SB0661_bin_34]